MRTEEEMIEDATLRTGTYLESCETPEGVIFGAWSEELKVIFNASDEQIAKAIASTEQEEINLKARQYLKDTDWYITRQAETGVPVPADILLKRQEARDAITGET
jgi:hypothetical protein